MTPPKTTLAMPNLALVIGLVLVVVGALGYLLSGTASVTALIPAFLGGLLALLGFVGQRQAGARKHAMHAAAAVALLGLLGTFRGFLSFFTLIGGGFVARPFAVSVQALTAVLCVVFLVFAVRSFIQARRTRSPN